MFIHGFISVLFGHKIDTEGLHSLPDKLLAVESAPTPRNVSELKFYLAWLTFYGKFLLLIWNHCIDC